MKIASFLLLCLLSIAVCAQNADPRLFDTQWYLSMLVVGGNNIAIPATSELESIPLFLTKSRYETMACDGFGSDLNSFDDTSFIAEAWFFLPMGCTQQSTLDFQDFYFEDFLKSAEFNVPFTYTLEEIGTEGLRLTVINNDGDTAVYGNPALEVQEVPAISITVYPNPTADFLNLETNGAIISTASIYSIMGREALSFKEINTNTTLDVRSLPIGIYFMSFVSETGQQQLHKFIKK